MGIDVVLQDEKCNNISEVVYDPEGLIVTTLQSLGDATGCCARFIDPYGDTVFNHLQADVLLGEWDTLKSSFTALNAQALWCAVRRMITRCAEEPHTYLRFSGDWGRDRSTQRLFIVAPIMSRWENGFRMIVSQTGSRVAIYGVASTDSHAPSGHYRYTVGVKATEARQSEARRPDDMCSVHIPASDWLVFRSNFANLFGQLWQDNPYQLVTQLGWKFNTDANLHIDVFHPAYTNDGEDDFEFRMPVTRLSPDTRNTPETGD